MTAPHADAPAATVPPPRSRAVQALVVVLIVLGGLAIAVGAPLLFARQNLLGTQQFGDAAARAAAEPEVQVWLAERLTERVVASGEPLLVSVKPMVQATIEGVLGTDAFSAIARRAGSAAYDLLATGSAQTVVLAVNDALVLAKSVLETTAPTVADALPAPLPGSVVVSGQEPLSRLTGIVARLGTAGVVLPLVGLSFMLIAVWVARRNRVAAFWSGVAVAAAGVLDLLVLWLGQWLLLRGVDDPVAHDAAAAVLGAMLDGLGGFLLTVTAVGTLVAGAALTLIRPVDVSDLVDAGWRRLSRTPPTPLARMARAVAVGVAGVALVANPIGVLRLIGVVAGTLALIFALSEFLRVTGSDRAAGVVDQMRARRREDQDAAEREERRRARLGVVGVASVLVMGVGIWLGLAGGGGSASAAESGCNGHAELCGRPVTGVAMAATHNSMSAANNPGWYRAEHYRTIPEQLAAGVRGLLVDTYYGVADGGTVKTDFYKSGVSRQDLVAEIGEEGVEAAESLSGTLGFGAIGGDAPRGVYLCHGACELGALDAVTAFGEIRQFLVLNPGAVIIMVIQDQTSPADIQEVFARSGLLDLVYQHPDGEPWPTLGDLVAADQRVIVMAEHATDPSVPWLLPAFGEDGVLMETPYTFHEPSEFSCKPNRGGTGRPFFLLNHWIQEAAPSPQVASQVNAYDVLLDRARTCEAERDHIPNLVAVDFSERGDAVAVADTLNGFPPAP